VKAPAFAYVRPHTLAETFELLDRYGDDARLLAGGQSLIAALNMRLAAPRVLIDINALPGLDAIEARGGGLAIGALARHRALERSAAVARHAPLLAPALPHLAHPAVRNRGTFGGSMAFADPAAELPACSVALDARLHLASRSGERVVPARAFFRGFYDTALARGEILVGAEIPPPQPGERCSFQELARRHGDYAIVGLAARACVAAGVLSDVSLAFLGAGTTPVLAGAAARELEGATARSPAVARAQAALDAELAPFDDAQVSAAARRQLARVLLGRAVAALAGDA